MFGFRLLNITMLVAFLFLAVKLADTVHSGELLGAAMASDEKPKEEKPKEEEKKEEPKKEETAEKKEEGKEGEKKEGEKKEGAKAEAPAPTPMQPQEKRFTPTEIQILQNLSKRREALDAQNENMQVREVALRATEQRIDGKIQQIEAMKAQVEEMLARYNTQEDAKIRSLVKIYETMKPKDAARIFDEVEMPILLLVIDRMKEKSAAPILAAMDPKKAKQLTVELAEQRRLDSQKLTQRRADAAAAAAAGVSPPANAPAPFAAPPASPPSP